MTVSLLILALCGILFTGWVGALSPWDHKKRFRAQICLLVISAAIGFLIMGVEEFLHFSIDETFASTAMVLAIIGVASFDFGFTPKNGTSLWIVIGVITPLLSNLGTSVLVLPLALGVSKYVFETYPKGRAFLIMMVMIMMCANTLAVFTYQADLPTTAYKADQLAGMPYAQGDALGMFRPAGIIGYIVYLVILWGLGVRPRWEKVGIKVTDKWSLVSAILICVWFLIAMNQVEHQIYWYLSGVFVAFTIGYIKVWILPKPIDVAPEVWKKSSANHPRELGKLYLETGIMFLTIFCFISWIPVEGLEALVASNPWLQPLLVVTETLCADNLIAYNANKVIGFQGEWSAGIALTLYGSIGYGAHFIMGHAVSIMYWINQMDGDKIKVWTDVYGNKAIDDSVVESGPDESHRPGVGRWGNHILSGEYKKILIPLSVVASVCLFPLTITSQMGIYFGGVGQWVLPIIFGALAIVLFRLTGRFVENMK